MLADYSDILALTDREPMWYDSNGTPRYAPFHPDLCPNIYAREVVLVKIQCQACSKPFLVEMHWHPFRSERPSISDALDKGNLGYLEYGDPPRHGHEPDGNISCYAGDTMLSEEVEIVEFWQQKRKWKRRKKYEISLRC